MPEFKLVVVGDGGVGKTSIANHLVKGGEFEKRYIATIGVEVQKYEASTSVGPVMFNVWNCAGQEKFRGLADGVLHPSQLRDGGV